MPVDITKAPFPVRYRELWLPRSINNNVTLPSSCYNGHGLTLTGARKGTTCDGVHGTGVNTSNINCGAIHDNIAKFWASLRFKLVQPWVAGMGELYLWGKRIDGDNLLTLYLDNNGMLHFYMRTAATDRFILLSTITSWNAGQWYHCIGSLSDTAGGKQRLLVNNTLEDSDVQAAANTPNGGDFVLLDLDDPGFGNGFRGVEVDVFAGTDDLTAAEETDLSKGIPPADTVNEYLLDEGRGVTAIDRGSGGNNGTLDTSATWAWGQVEQPVLSLDGINDRAVSLAGVNHSGNLTMVWVRKMKSTYNGLSANHFFFDCRGLVVDNYIHSYYVAGLGIRSLSVRGSPPTVEETVVFTPFHAIDDYLIMIGTVVSGVNISSYINGRFLGTIAMTTPVSGAGSTLYIGCNSTPALFDISKPLFIGIIEGAFTDKQVLAYSRWLNDILGMRISI